MDWDKEEKNQDQRFSYFLKGMKIFWELLGNQKKKIVLAVLLIVCMGTLFIASPYILKLIFDEMQVGAVKKQIPSILYIYIGILFGLEFFIRIFIFKIKEPITIKIINYLQNWWPRIVQEKLLKLSLGYHERENVGKKISKINKGCAKLASLLERLCWNMIPQLVYLSVNLIVIIVIDWRLGLMFFLPFIPAAIVLLKAFKILVPMWNELDEKREKGNGFFCQSLLNFKTVQSFVQEKHEGKKFSEVCQQMESLGIQVDKKLLKYYFWMDSILELCFIVTISVGVIFAIKGISTLGTVVYIVATGGHTMRSLWQMLQTYTNTMKDMVSVSRMKELLDEDIDIKNSPNAIIPDEYRGNFALNKISFNYKGKDAPILDNVSLRMRSGEMTALVGLSGAGKTTIVRLLCRLYDIEKGVIMLDGNDIRSLDLYWYRRLFAIVPQEVDIFDDTIFENIVYGAPAASRETVLEAVRAAQLQVVLEDKEKFPDGLETQVGERGVKLSGGECQRVGIARAYVALLCGARVLVLDEATSNLDSKSEKAIQEMISALRNRLDISIVVIAHRLSTVKRSDKIYVLEDGEILEEGNHLSLFNKNGRYAQLVNLQKLT